MLSDKILAGFIYEKQAKCELFSGTEDSQSVSTNVGK